MIGILVSIPNITYNYYGIIQAYPIPTADKRQFFTNKESEKRVLNSMLIRDILKQMDSTNL
jgi:hypothetical protein